MNSFAELLDRLAYEPSRNNKLRLIEDYFRRTPDPDRGWALAAFTSALSFRHAKPSTLKALMAEKIDPVLFDLSRDYVGDLSETIALLWQPVQQTVNSRLSLDEIVRGLSTLGKTELAAQLSKWLDMLDENGRWALLKLVTGGLRIGVSARLAKTAAAALGDKSVTEIELMWNGLEPPYLDLFSWLEGRAEKPISTDPAPFRPAMLAHAFDSNDFAKLSPANYVAEWKWDGIRVQAVAGRGEDGNLITRLYSRTGEDISKSFPDLTTALKKEASLDGELLVMRDGRVQSFNVLQQRLNRKAVTQKLMQEFPAHLRAYDILSENGEDLRDRPFHERRTRLESFVSSIADERIDISPLIPFNTWQELTAVRVKPEKIAIHLDAEAVEGVMLKQSDSAYLPGRPKGYWWKWKRDPHVIDAVLMYAQRGHGKRSSFYSDYTFGVWAPLQDKKQLVPVGKAYFGFTDEELKQIDCYVRRNTTNKFGPVREVIHDEQNGLVFEVAFEGLARSKRHKSGIAMRFPRISRLRWDKPPGEADTLETLEKMLTSRGSQISAPSGEPSKPQSHQSAVERRASTTRAGHSLREE